MTSLTEDELIENYRILINNLEYCKYIVLQINSKYKDEQLFENSFELIAILHQKFDLYNEYISFDSSNLIYNDLPPKCKEILDLIYKCFKRFYYLVDKLEVKGSDIEYLMNDNIFKHFKDIFNVAIIIQNKILECYDFYECNRDINHELVNIIDNLKII